MASLIWLRLLNFTVFTTLNNYCTIFSLHLTLSYIVSLKLAYLIAHPPNLHRRLVCLRGFNNIQPRGRATSPLRVFPMSSDTHLRQTLPLLVLNEEKEKEVSDFFFFLIECLFLATLFFYGEQKEEKTFSRTTASKQKRTIALALSCI